MNTSRWLQPTSILGAVLLSLALQGCGGGSSDPAPAPADPAASAPATSVTVQGRALNTADGQPLPGASVTVNGTQVQTDGLGRYTLKVASLGNGVLRAEQAGFSPALGRAVAGANGGTPVTVDLWLSPVGATAQVTASAGGDIGVAGSSARVSLPPSALADAATGQAYTGNAEVRLTPIDPGNRPAAMPGSYTARTATGTETIESFGALHVEIRDPATGRALNLAAGKTATIRIPLATRNPTPPTTLPLYHLDEATGIWVAEGTATLVGTGPTAYYEGTVSHFSYWNADQAVETIYVDGCVRQADGSIPAPLTVETEGIDYSGQAQSESKPDGTFRVALRKGGKARLTAYGAQESDPLEVGPSETDIHLTTCRVLHPVAPPTIVQQPIGLRVSGGAGYVYVLASGRDLHYQWRRNGVDILGATGPVLTVADPSADAPGTLYSVVVSNASGSVTSLGTAIKEIPVPPSVSGDAAAARLMFLGYLSWDLALSPSQLADTDLVRMRSPSTVCTAGNLAQAFYDGANLAGGEAVTASTPHRIDVTFNNCTSAESGNAYSGRAAMDFSYTRGIGGAAAITGTTTLTDLRTDELVGQGQYAFSVNTDSASGNSLTMTPASGASLKSNASGLTAVFNGGSLGLSTTLAGGSAYQANNFAFTVGTTPYVTSGELRVGGANPGGELVLTSGGVTVGRIVMVNGVMSFETNGKVEPF